MSKDRIRRSCPEHEFYAGRPQGTCAACWTARLIDLRRWATLAKDVGHERVTLPDGSVGFRALSRPPTDEERERVLGFTSHANPYVVLDLLAERDELLLKLTTGA